MSRRDYHREYYRRNRVRRRAQRLESKRRAGDRPAPAADLDPATISRWLKW